MPEHCYMWAQAQKGQLITCNTSVYKLVQHKPKISNLEQADMSVGAMEHEETHVTEKQRLYKCKEQMCPSSLAKSQEFEGKAAFS